MRRRRDEGERKGGDSMVWRWAKNDDKFKSATVRGNGFELEVDGRFVQLVCRANFSKLHYSVSNRINISSYPYLYKSFLINADTISGAFSPH